MYVTDCLYSILHVSIDVYRSLDAFLDVRSSMFSSYIQFYFMALTAIVILSLNVKLTICNGH